MKKNIYDFSFTSYSIIDENNKLIKHRIVNSDANYKNLYKSNFIGLNTVMINKEFFVNKFSKFNNSRGFCFVVKALQERN